MNYKQYFPKVYNTGYFNIGGFSLLLRRQAIVLLIVINEYKKIQEKIIIFKIILHIIISFKIILLILMQLKLFVICNDKINMQIRLL